MEEYIFMNLRAECRAEFVVLRDRERVTRGWREIFKDELLDVCSSSNTDSAEVQEDDMPFVYSTD
jgi:hypothetical protein